MPIKIPNDLPALKQLEKEKVNLIINETAIQQDIRPMKIILLNLMPTKRKTEVQFARLLGNSPLQVELTLMTTSSYQSKNEEKSYLEKFYITLEDIKDQFYDALIITGAPIETLPFEEVGYWKELQEIILWSKTHVFQRLGVCWGAQALMYDLYSIQKHQLEKKLFGIFPHDIKPAGIRLMQGFSNNFPMPVSRHTKTKKEDVLKISDLSILAESEISGLGMVCDYKRGNIYILNHLEYDSDTLKNEYLRDLKDISSSRVPANYFPENNPSKEPENYWRPFAFLLFSNWINQLYQKTPYDLSSLLKN